MDLFDLGQEHNTKMLQMRQHRSKLPEKSEDRDSQYCNLTVPVEPYTEQPLSSASQALSEPVMPNRSQPPNDLIAGLTPLRDLPTLVMGVASDILFPAWQQREIAETLRAAGNQSVTYIELGEDTSLFGHDTFLLDLKHIGGNIRRFLG